nr:helix-turn-helix domain-containing protein [Phytoactinopolyspora mesophila]
MKFGKGDVFDINCPARTILDHVTSRWGVLVLAALSQGPMRFSELRRRVTGVSEKMLSQTLRTLVSDGFIGREVTPAVPPQVSYSLTPLGADLAQRVVELVNWIDHHVADPRLATSNP